MSEKDIVYTLEEWLQGANRELQVGSNKTGLTGALHFYARLIQHGVTLAAGGGPTEVMARADVWGALPRKWAVRGDAAPPPFPLDPFFIECVRRASGNKELVKEFDRLCGTNLSMRGAPIVLMVDQATGALDDGLRKFLAFVREFIYERIDQTKAK